MRKKVSVFLLGAMFCFAFFCPAAASAEIIFLAVNDEFLDLSESTMPIRRGGQIYVPYRTFSQELGVYYSYNEAEQVLVYFNWDNTLTFDIGRGTVYDGDGISYANTAYLHNGTVYVPVNDIALKMGVYRAQMVDSAGTVVRLNRTAPSLSDSVFLYLGRSVMLEMADRFERAQNPDTGTSSGTGTGLTQQQKTVYLTFDGGPNEYTETVLELLTQYAYPATFFIEGGLLPGQDDLLRRMIAGGYTLGSLGYGSNAESFSESADAILRELSDTNEMLYRLAFWKTRLVRVPGVGSINEEERLALADAGYRVWGWHVELTEATSASRAVSQVTSALARREGGTVLRMSMEEPAAEALPGILDYLRRNRYIVKAAEEWMDPAQF